MALGGVLVVATPPAASTQTVGIRVQSWRCPQYGVFGISRVTVTGTWSGPNINADQSFTNTTQTARVSVQGVPPGGGAGHFTATYHCKVKVLWFYMAGPGEPAVGDRWVYGTPPQPTYTL
jgi:hypothetical protein